MKHMNDMCRITYILPEICGEAGLFTFSLLSAICNPETVILFEAKRYKENKVAFDGFFSRNRMIEQSEKKPNRKVFVIRGFDRSAESKTNFVQMSSFPSSVTIIQLNVPSEDLSTENEWSLDKIEAEWIMEVCDEAIEIQIQQSTYDQICDAVTQSEAVFTEGFKKTMRVQKRARRLKRR